MTEVLEEFDQAKDDVIEYAYEKWEENFKSDLPPKLKRIACRRWNRILLMFGEEALRPYHRVKPAKMNVIANWFNGQEDNEFLPVLVYLSEKAKEAEKVRPTFNDDGTVTIRGYNVKTNLKFFSDYCETNNDGSLEAMIDTWVSQGLVVKNMSDEDFSDLCEGRGEEPLECLTALFGDAGNWVSTPVDIAEELKEAQENIAARKAWEKEDAEKQAAAQAAYEKWKAERQALFAAAQ